MSVYIGQPYTVEDYTAMQGPCPDGFHIPNLTEWNTLYGIIKDTFGLTGGGTDLKPYLKMPYAGSRSYTNGDVSSQGTNGFYWLCTKSNNYDYAAYDVYISDGWYSLDNGSYRTIGRSIRAFKDEPVIPDNTWTTLYNGGDGSGIFHNSPLGVISISGDGQDWITIADKNVGATTVYNSGDTLSESNCGKYFQRGNCYGFPYTGSVTTTSSTVDASAYGPGNYYSSSTFKTGYTDWASPHNDNLWGGETGMVEKTLQPELSNAYIGIPNPESITLDKSSINLTTIGQTEQLTATLTPTPCDQRITWSTSDPTVAIVSTTGLVTCVTPGTATITATTVNGLTATCGVRQARLPSTYQEVEWIENTGQSYINTGVTYDTNGRVFQIKYGLPVGGAYTLFGNFPSWSESAGHTRYSKLTDGSLEWDCYAGRGYGRLYASGATTGIDELELGNNYIKDIPTDTVLVSGNTGSYTNSSATMKIFYRDGGANNGFATFKLYYFKIIDSGTPTRDFVPCYRIADSVIGLYDVVNDVFYTNAGSGTFAKGNDV